MHIPCHRFLLDQPSPSSTDFVAVVLVLKDQQDKPFFKHGAPRTPKICTLGFRNNIISAFYLQPGGHSSARLDLLRAKDILSKAICSSRSGASLGEPAYHLRSSIQPGTVAAFKPCTGKLGLATPPAISHKTSFSLLHPFWQLQLSPKPETRHHCKLFCTLRVGYCIRQSRMTCNLHPTTCQGFHYKQTVMSGHPSSQHENFISASAFCGQPS